MLQAEDRVKIHILKEAASMPTVSSPRAVRMKTEKKQAVRMDGNECLERYLRDVRCFAVLSRESERALAKQILESRTQWQEQLLEHLLYIPLLLAWGPRICQGAVRLTSLCRPGATPTITEFKTILQRLRMLRDQMREVVQGQDVQRATTIPILQATMRALFQDLDWRPEFLQQAWHKFHTAMTRATVAGQYRRAACYVVTLGYSLEVLDLLWPDLCRVYTVMEQAKQELVNHNLRLVISVVYKFRYTGMPLSDLIQDGNIGLMRAVDNFDYRRDLKFSTYAIWWIRQAIHRASSAQSLMRLPEYCRDNVRRVHQVLDAFIVEHGRTPTHQEIAQRTDIPLERVAWSLEHTPEQISIDNPLPGKQWPLREMLPDTHLVSSHEVLVQHALQRYTQDALACLTPREAAVISRRFGLGDTPVETLEQIGRDLHISRERVRQITATALDKLKQHKAMLQACLEQ
jgi:RNA polymerase sigma factor (sigma-70 family)